MLSLQRQFIFIIESARLYQGISTHYITTSMRRAANLPLGASAEEQDRLANDLRDFTKDCANEIFALAHEELIKTEDQFQVRLIEVEDELKTLPAQLEYVVQAIDQGIGEGAQQNLEQVKKPMEIYDDTWD